MSLQCRKRSAAKANLDTYLEKLHSAESTLTNEEYLDLIRSKFNKYASKKEKKQGTTNYILEKLCEVCSDYHHDDKLLLCDYCDDAFHTFCLTPALKKIPSEDEDWFCPVCVQQKYAFEKEKKRASLQGNQMKVQRLLEVYAFKNKKELVSKIQICGSCDDLILCSENDGVIEESDKCVKCTKFFHKNCFSKKKDSILCSDCQILVKKSIPKTQKLIDEFFTANVKAASKSIRSTSASIVSVPKTPLPPSSILSPAKRTRAATQSSSMTKKTQPIKEKLEKKFKKNDGSSMHTIQSNDSNFSESTCCSSSSFDTMTMSTNHQQFSESEIKKALSKKGVKFLLPKPSSNPIVNLECKQSLIFALKAKNITFCDDLTYSEKCTFSHNDTQLEPTLQTLDLANQIIFSKFKEMSRQGVYAPVRIEEDKTQGFIVRAMEDIPIRTLITEYVGEVDFARNHIFNKNDSIMDLLRTSRSKTSLVILPDKKGNLARFLSGINNTSKASMAKQNVSSVRYNINGQSHVILYAKKLIKKGSLLYYDYNAGGFGEYPTQDFV